MPSTRKSLNSDDGTSHVIDVETVSTGNLLPRARTGEKLGNPDRLRHALSVALGERLGQILEEVVDVLDAY